MRDQDYIDEGCVECDAGFGSRVAGNTYLPESEKADPSPRLWCEWSHITTEDHGPDHLLPSERKAWEEAKAWEMMGDITAWSEDIWDSKLDWVLGEDM